MQAAGVTRLGGPITLVELPGPGRPGPGEVLLDVRAGGVGNWDEFVRTGGWDTGVRPPMALGGRVRGGGGGNGGESPRPGGGAAGARPPMALGVEAAGRVAAVGDGVQGIAPGD